MFSIFRTRLIGLIVIVLVLAASVAAQNIQNPQAAVDNLLRSSMHVDESTGAMQLQIPLGAYRGRGEASLPITLSYSSKVWNIKYLSTAQCSGEPVSAYNAEYARSSASGWTSTAGWFLPTQDLTLETYEGLTQKPAHVGNPNLWRIARLYVTLSDGSRHELRRDDSLHNLSESMSGTYYAVDGSRLMYDLTSGTLFMPNGSRIMGTGGAIQYVDRNGHFFSYNPNTSTWTDTLGRNFTIPIPGTAPTAGDYTYTMPGLNGGTITYTMRW